MKEARGNRASFFCRNSPTISDQSRTALSGGDDAVSFEAKSQNADDFMSVAKRLECDDDKTRFEAKLGKLAKAKGRRASK